MLFNNCNESKQAANSFQTPAFNTCSTLFGDYKGIAGFLMKFPKFFEEFEIYKDFSIFSNLYSLCMIL